jgi:vacuolar protein sorting-associated protein 13A/C
MCSHCSHDSLYRAKLDIEAKEVINESVILQPITFGLLMLRNLSAGWYKEIPDIDVSGRLETIKVSVHFCTKHKKINHLF